MKGVVCFCGEVKRTVLLYIELRERERERERLDL
jgi:hypothetical protein